MTLPISAKACATVGGNGVMGRNPGRIMRLAGRESAEGVTDK
jgi:hypothetical protein